MNKMTFASIAAVTAALMTSPVRANAGHGHHDHGDEVAAAVGGFIGGVIVASAINSHLPPPPPVVTVSYGHDHGTRHGHWEMRRVRVWVPGYWTVVERRHDRPRRVWVDGYYEVRRERVWVAHRGYDRCDRD